MVSLMLVAENERESQILKMAFEQRGITVLPSKAKYQNYIKTLQYMPDIILMELPRPCIEQLHFAELLKSHKKAKRIPLLGYGETMETAEKNGIVKVGVNYYFTRPLKFTQIVKVIETLLKQFNKSLDIQPISQDKEKDIELLLASDTLPMKKIEIMSSYVSSMLAFPFTVAKVLSLAESLKSAASDLARVIESDPVLSAQILKLSNSVLFASLNRRISSIKDAIVRIGFKETKRLVMSVSVMKLFEQDNKSIGFDRLGFWCHSLATAIISERIARRAGTVNSDEVFLAGLLHDFGIIVLDEFFPTLFFKIIEDTTNSGGLFIEREKALLGIHHNDVLAELFTKWKLPDFVREGIVRQYDVESFKDAIDTPEKKYAACVAMANILAKTVSLGRECDQYVTPLPKQLFSFAKMPTGFTKAFLDEVYNEMNIYREFLKLDIPDPAGKSEGMVLSDKSRIGVANLASDVFVPPFLFFQKEGFNITFMDSGGDPSRYNSSFDIIQVWADAATTPDQVKAFSRIVKYSDPTPSPETSPVFTPAYTPVLAILPPENAQAFRELASNPTISCAYNRLDVRQLDKFASIIMLGKTVSLADIDTQLKSRIDLGTLKSASARHSAEQNKDAAITGNARTAETPQKPAAAAPATPEGIP
jgi:HD-like signal output (HDOD) protein/ActR/RegA family two-component response regulator